MTALEAFNALDNREVSRKEVEQVLTQAKAENNTAIIYRLSRVLNDSPEATHFEITITHYDSPVGLSGVQHTGDYREALDDCGRLRKGWKFVKGNVVKVEEKPKKEAKPKKEKAPQKEGKNIGNTVTLLHTERFKDDLSYDALERSYSWISFDPEKRAKREQQDWADSMEQLYNSHAEQAQQTGALEAYNAAFEKGYSSLLKNYKEMISIRARTFSTAITGGAGITARKIASNESLMQREYEKLKIHNQEVEKLKNKLAKIAKNTPADQYETGEVVKSVDVNAIAKLQDKIKQLEEKKEYIYRQQKAEKEYKKSKDSSVFEKYDIKKEDVEKMLDEINRYGYALYSSPANINAEIRRIRERIAGLEKNQSKGEEEILIEGGKIVKNGATQRLQIFFDGIPDKDIREKLKRHAFKWAPSVKAWQRTLTPNAIWDVEHYLLATGILKKQGLSGVQHTGDYREALDDCGRLRKGWKFVKGNVIKVEEKPKKEAQPKKEKAPKKEETTKEVSGPKVKDEEVKEEKATSKRLQILENSLKKKEEKFNEKLSELYSDVKSANGQPLNDKSNGKSTMARWDKKDNALRTLNKEIERTKEAIEREQFKINRVETVNEFIPAPILELVEKGVLNQWRKHPDRFFVEGVEKGRIIFDRKKGELLNQYYNSIPTQEQKEKFKKVFNTLKEELAKIPSEERTAYIREKQKREKEDHLNYLNKEIENVLERMEKFESKSKENKEFSKKVKELSEAEAEALRKKTPNASEEWWYIPDVLYYRRLQQQLRDLDKNVQDSSKKKVEKAPAKATKSLKSRKEKGENVAKETKEEDNFSEQVEKREALLKRANLYRKARKDGYSYDEIYKRAKDLGDKDIDLIMNLSYLNPKGDMINSFLYHIDKEEEYLKMVNWTGEARRLYPDLDDKKEDFFCDLIYGNFYKEKTKDFFFKGIEDWHTRRTERANILKSILNKYKITLDYHSFNLFLEGISNDLYKSNYKELPEYDKYFFYFKLENRLNEKIINDLKKYFVNRIEEKKLKKVGLGDDKYSYKGELHQKGIEILRIIFRKLKEEKGLSGVDYSQGLFGAVPEISTERFKKMSVPELREYTLEYYLENYGGKSISKNFFKEDNIQIEFFNTAGKKLQKPIYKEKVAVLEHLESLIKNSTYNNWGNRKESSPPNIIGYLNFKAKVTIDGEKRHVRISIAVDEKRKFRFKTLEVGANPKKKKQATSIPAPSVTERLRDSSLSEDKGTKKSLSRKKKEENFGLNASEAPVTSLPVPRQTLAQQLATRPEVRESFLVADEQMSLFLGALEKKTKDSLVITLTGKQGSGKTRFAFQFMNALAQRYRVGHASIEEHPESVLYEEKAYQYLNDTALEHITAQDVRSLTELDTMIRTNEVIVIDSFQKMRELAPKFEVDKDLRKKYDGKLFLVIFQQTADGKMRGGSKSQFDGDIILFTETFPDYRENYVYPDKNRYNKRPATELQYSIYEQRMLATAPEEPALPAHYEPTESEELNFEVL